MLFKCDTIFFTAFTAGIVLMGCNGETGKTSASKDLRTPGVNYQTYKGETGFRKTFFLPDSSKVILNAESILEVPENYQQGNRAVILDGDAFFDVKPGKDSFSVTSDKLKATVLGATFRMRSFAAQHGATLYVLNGKLKVGKSYFSPTDNQPEILERGQMVLANNEIDLMEKETYQPEELESWLADSLVIHDLTIMQLSRKLEDWYGVEITIEGDGTKLKDIPSLTFTHASLEDVLKQLGNSIPLKYKIGHNTVKVTLK